LSVMESPFVPGDKSNFHTVARHDCWMRGPMYAFRRQCVLTLDSSLNDERNQGISLNSSCLKQRCLFCTFHTLDFARQ
jgi:hypothetical protein